MAKIREETLLWMRVRPTLTTRVLLIDRLHDLPRDLRLASDHFMMFIACDFATVDDDMASTFIRRSIDQGCVWMHCWGPGADHMHDLFDAVRTEIDPLGADEDAYLMCTSHDDFFADRFWYFLYATRPPARFMTTCRNRIAIAVNAPQCHSAMHRYLADPQVLDEITTRHMMDDDGPYGRPDGEDDASPSP